MYELQEFERRTKEKRKKRGSIRQALEDGRLRPIPFQLPKMVERRRQSGDQCNTATKVILSLIVLSLIAMLLYAIWRIRVIEEPSETSDYDYRMIGEGEINDNDANDNNVDKT